MVRRRPLRAFSSGPSLALSYEEVDLRGIEDSASIECRVITSGRLGADFSESLTGGREWCSSAWCFSAIADTAASTLSSNSLSVMVSVVRSKFSMNCMAPDYYSVSTMLGLDEKANLPVMTDSSLLLPKACLDF